MNDQLRLSELLATPDAFHAWLAQLPADVLVGRANACSNCPLALWLTEAMGCSVAVCVRVVYADTIDVSVSLPDWARAFIHAVDCLGHRWEQPDVTAGAAHRALTRVLRVA